jgi:hypothetical protein
MAGKSFRVSIQAVAIAELPGQSGGILDVTLKRWLTSTFDRLERLPDRDPSLAQATAGDGVA